MRLRTNIYWYRKVAWRGLYLRQRQAFITGLSCMSILQGSNSLQTLPSGFSKDLLDPCLVATKKQGHPTIGHVNTWSINQYGFMATRMKCRPPYVSSTKWGKLVRSGNLLIFIPQKRWNCKVIIDGGYLVVFCLSTGPRMIRESIHGYCPCDIINEAWQKT